MSSLIPDTSFNRFAARMHEHYPRPSDCPFNEFKLLTVLAALADIEGRPAWDRGGRVR